MQLLVDALNIRWGGGLTVMKRVVGGFLDAGHKVDVMLNDPALADGFDPSDNLMLNTIAGTASALGALRFRHGDLHNFARQIAPDGILSFNYFTPSRIPQATYHINTIPYLPFAQRRRTAGLVRAVVLRHYGNQALHKSKLNMFESGYLRDLVAAQERVHNPHVAHIGTDAPETKPVRKIDPDRPIIACVTSGAPHKRNAVVIGAFREFERHHPMARLQLIGEADYIRTNLPAADQCYVENNKRIEFTGYVDRETLFDLLAEATCLVTASELESFFMVAIEAMRVGCPVVATDISSIRESVGDNALLFPAGDGATAAKHMLTLTQDPTTLDAQAAARWAAGFDADACAANIAALVERELGAAA